MAEKKQEQEEIDEEYSYDDEFEVSDPKVADPKSAKPVIEVKPSVK